MIRFFLILATIYLFSLSVWGQSENPCASCAKKGSHLYLPFDFGLIKPLNNANLSKSFYLTSGVEYRYIKDHGWFARGSWDIYSSKYLIGQNFKTNAVKGRLNYNSFLLGGGYRKVIKSDAWKLYSLVQAGLNFSGYNHIGASANNYEVKEKGIKSLVIKGGVGLEWYPTKDPDFAISLEPVYVVFPTTNIFWSKSNHQLGVKIGINATLF